MEMNKFTLLTIFSVVYIVALIIIYYSKERLRTKETRIYKAILFSNLFGLLFQFLCWVVSKSYNILNPTLSNFVLKTYLLYFIIFGALLLVYILVISACDDKILKKIIFIYLGLGVVVYFLPISLHVDLIKNAMYSYGAAVNFSYIVGGITSALIIIMLIKEIKKVSKKKLLPLLLYLIFSGIAILIQRLNPEFMLICYVESFLCFIMYFTIENPDIKMLNELYKNKELMEQSYEDRYNFLFEMTQEARSPINDINSVVREIRKEEISDNIKDKVDYLNVLTRRLDFSINNILNISSLDVSKIKIINNKYELDKICNDVITKIKPSVKPDVNLTVSLPKQIPVLFGDYMKLKQIIYSLLINSCKNTENGSINLKVNLIEKYDVARVIINISDTGIGMPIDKINELLSVTGELDREELENLDTKEYNIKVCQKVVKIMGGNLMIKSQVGEGTEMILTIDQKVYHEKDRSILNLYESDIVNYKKALVIAQDKELINNVKRIFTRNNITGSYLYYGKDGVDKIKSGKKYDFILIEDEMKEITGYETLKELNKINSFNIPCIIMLKEDKDNIKDHFVEDGFSDYVMINNLDDNITKIIEKY